jgi:hypothetical protein
VVCNLRPNYLIDRSVLKGDDMLRTRFVFGLSVLFLAGGIVVAAQGQGNAPKTTNKPTAPKAAAPAPHTTTKAAPVKPAQVKAAQPTMKGKSPSPSPASTKTHASKPTTTKSASAAPPKASPAKSDKTPSKVTAKVTTKPAKTDKPETKLAKADKPAKSTKSTSTSTSTKTTTGSTTTTTELTPVQQKLQKNTNLAAKVASRLPQGTDLMTAAAGFKNLGQFVAAANVSHNLQISFTELKAKMMTGMSLGQAIQAVRPLTASPTVEAQRAEYDARGMIAESEPTTSAPSSTTGTTSITTPASTPTSTTPKPKAKTKSSAQ